MKNTYELTIPETLVPIGNPIGHLHRPAPSVFLKTRRALVICRITLVHGGGSLWSTVGSLLGRPLLGRLGQSGLTVNYRHDQMGPWVKSIREIAPSNGLCGPEIQPIYNGAGQPTPGQPTPDPPLRVRSVRVIWAATHRGLIFHRCRSPMVNAYLLPNTIAHRAPTTWLCRLSSSGPAHTLGCRPPMVFWQG